MGGYPEVTRPPVTSYKYREVIKLDCAPMSSYEKTKAGWPARLKRSYDQNRAGKEALRQVTEQVVATADPTIRQVNGYHKILRTSVVDATKYCRTLVDVIPGPVTLSKNRYYDDPLVKALFASPIQLEEVLCMAPATRELRRQGVTGEVVAMLTMSKEEKTIFGHQKEGELIRRDVVQQAVSFFDHRIVAPTDDLEQTREGIINRGLEVLATVAMERITGLKSRKAELREKREYLKGMMKIMSGRSRMVELFSVPDPSKIVEFHKAGKKLAEVEAELAQLSGKIAYPEHSLGYLKEIMENPNDSLVVSSQSFRLDWKGVRVENQPDVEGNDITLAEFSVHDEFKRSAVLVKFEMQTD